jgi:hypothetical protein
MLSGIHNGQTKYAKIRYIWVAAEWINPPELVGSVIQIIPSHNCWIENRKGIVANNRSDRWWRAFVKAAMPMSAKNPLAVKLA